MKKAYWEVKGKIFYNKQDAMDYTDKLMREDDEIWGVWEVSEYTNWKSVRII